MINERCWILVRFPEVTDEEGSKKHYSLNDASAISVHSILPSAISTALRLGLDCDKEIIRASHHDIVEPKIGSDVYIISYEKQDRCPEVYKSYKEAVTRISDGDKLIGPLMYVA